MLTVHYKSGKWRMMGWDDAEDADDAIRKTAEAECVPLDALDVIQVTDESGEDVMGEIP